MITINLLPDELRIVEKKSYNSQIVRIGLLFAGLFVGVTLFFYADYWVSSGKLKAAKKQWAEKQTQYQSLMNLRAEIDGPLVKENDFMERFVTTHQPLTHILVWGSEFLPTYAWLKELTMSREDGEGKLRIRGLAYSAKDISSIEQIEEYLQQLKAKLPESLLSLTTARVEYAGIMLTQFFATYVWKDRAVYEQIT